VEKPKTLVSPATSENKIVSPATKPVEIIKPVAATELASSKGEKPIEDPKPETITELKMNPESYNNGYADGYHRAMEQIHCTAPYSYYNRR
jgi:hypothetical protein